MPAGKAAPLGGLHASAQRPTVHPALRNSEFMRRLDRDALERIAAAGQTRRFAEGTAIFKQGEASTSLHMLLEGRVNITHHTAAEERFLLSLTQPGEIVGGASAFRGAPYASSAFAACNAQLMTWSAPQISELFRKFPLLTINALTIVGKHADELMARMREIAHQPVEQRLASAILRIVDISPDAGKGGGNAVEVLLTRRELADLVGTTFYTVSRIASAWARDRIVINGRNRITVRDIDRLRKIRGT